MLSQVLSGNAVPAKKISEVESQFIFCDKQNENLASAISLLETRLSPVLRGKNKGEEACEKEPELTPIANDIRKIGNNMGFFVERIRDILARLEI